jgi:peptidase M28-like protein
MGLGGIFRKQSGRQGGPRLAAWYAPERSPLSSDSRKPRLRPSSWAAAPCSSRGHDSLAPDSHEPHLGADDNASGVAGLLEAAWLLAAKRERRPAAQHGETVTAVVLREGQEVKLSVTFQESQRRCVGEKSPCGVFPRCDARRSGDFGASSRGGMGVPYRL